MTLPASRDISTAIPRISHWAVASWRRREMW